MILSFLLVHRYQATLEPLTKRVAVNKKQLRLMPELKQRVLQQQQLQQQLEQKNSARQQQQAILTQFIGLSRLSISGLVVDQVNWLADELTIAGHYHSIDAVKQLLRLMRQRHSLWTVDVSFPRSGQFLLLAYDDREQ